MNVFEDIPQPTPITVIKPTFYRIAFLYELDYKTLQLIAIEALVDKSVLPRMFADKPVFRVDAEKMLLALSQYLRLGTDSMYTLENVQVKLHPTFAEICTTHKDIFRIDTLAEMACVDVAIIDMLIAGAPVSTKNAKLVLGAASRLADKQYSLENVDIVTAD